jgi:hypothetical protein
MTTGASPSYPVTTIAKLLKLTERQVQSLAAQGIIPKADRGKYELVPVVQAYIGYLRERRVGGDVGDTEDVTKLKARLIRARVRAAEAEADQINGSLLPRKDVEESWIKIVSAMRSRLLSIPSKIAPIVHSSLTVAQASAAISAAVNEALEEISRIPVYTSAKPVSSGDHSLDGEIGAEDGGAPAGADGEPVG